MFSSNKSKFTFISIVATSLLFSLFQNCGSAAPKQQAGDPSDPTVLDTNGPQISIIEKPALLTNDSTATFQLAVSDDRTGVDYVEYQHNGGEWKRIVNMLMLSDLPSGNHEVKFKAYDKNKNESKIILYKWNIDADKPVVTVTSAPNVLSSEASFGSAKMMTIKFTSSDNAGISSSVCKIDGKELNCGTNKQFSAPMTLGHHSASIAVTDLVGNTTTVAKYWSVSAGSTATVIAPSVFKSPAQHNNQTIVEIRFYGTPLGALPAGSKYTCRLNGDVVTPCSPNGINKYEGMKERIVSGKVVANVFVVALQHGSMAEIKSSPVSWFTDMTPPTVAFTTTKPAAMSLTTNPEFKITTTDNVAESELSLVCQLDGVAFAGCTPNVVFNISVSPGNHKLDVAAKDEAGNMSNVISHMWTTASCDMGSLAMRFPMRGPENSNWSVLSFVDANTLSGQVKDWGFREGARARTMDQETQTHIYPGDNITVFGADLKSRSESARVVAMAAGKVLKIVQDKTDTSIAGVPTGCVTSDYNVVSILHDNGFISHYKHLAKNSVPSNVVKGERVERGQIIGYAGSSGCLRRPHLAVQVEKCQRGNYVDPFAMSMQVDTQAMAYDGNPIIYNLLIHNRQLSGEASDMKSIMNRTFQYKSTAKATLASGITATFHAAKLTVGESLMVSVSRKTNTDFKTFEYQTVDISENSKGRFVIRRFKPTIKGEWTFRILHRNTDDCRSTNKDKWKDCVLQSADFIVD